MKIVIVDDDILVASALKTILEAGEDVTVAGTGRDGSDALSLYREHRPDVLLMDIRMQKVSGLDASKQIMEEYPEARILLLTTFADDEYIVKALKYGVKGYTRAFFRRSGRCIPARQYLGRRLSLRFRSFCMRRRHLTGKLMISARRNCTLYLWWRKGTAIKRLRRGCF